MPNDMNDTERAKAIKSGLGRQKEASKKLTKEVDEGVNKVARIM